MGSRLLCHRKGSLTFHQLSLEECEHFCLHVTPQGFSVLKKKYYTTPATPKKPQEFLGMGFGYGRAERNTSLSLEVGHRTNLGQQMALAGWCSTLTWLLICSSFSREKDHPVLIYSSLSTSQLTEWPGTKHHVFELVGLAVSWLWDSSTKYQVSVAEFSHCPARTKQVMIGFTILKV